MTVMVSGTPATSWELGILAGTGRMGAIVHGTPARHVLTLSHEAFFIPANSRRPAPRLAGIMPQLRAALNSGDEVAAADLVEGALVEDGWDPETLNWTDPLGPLAALQWTPDIASDISEYRREISMTDGACAVSWDTTSGSAGMRVHARHGDDHLLLELWSSTDLSGVLTLSPVHETAADATTVTPVDYSDSIHTTTLTTEDSTVIQVDVQGQHPGTSLTATTSVRVSPGTVNEDNGWRLHIPAGSSVTVRIEVAIRPDITESGRIPPSLQGTDLTDEVDALAGSCLQLTRSTSQRTEQVWARARAGEPDGVAEAIQIAYSAGRRNILISTGVLPPTLQGVWQGTWSPAWSADYTLNGNVQLGALAGVLWTGTPGLMRSLFRLIVPFADHYRSNASRIYGLPGMLLPARLTTHGHANHFLRDYPHQFWVGSGPWFLRLCADYISVTGDRSILTDWLWDFTLDILTFSEHYLDAGEGTLVPSYSPENTPADRENPLSVDAAADIAVLRDAFAVGAWLADLTGDHDRAAAWRAARQRVPDYSIAADGTLAEWAFPWSPQLAHRHASHLHGLWYEPDERFDTGTLRLAAREAVLAKIRWRAAAPEGPPGRMEMAFGLTSLGLAAAALGDASSAYQCLLWLARDHMTPALTTTHDAGAIFNLDASGAIPALIAAMLLQSRNGEISLLPALPDLWTTGSITGLKARGGISIPALKWDADGALATIDTPEQTRWLRHTETVLRVPRPAVLQDGEGVEQRDARTFVIDPSRQRTRLCISWV